MERCHRVRADPDIKDGCIFTPALVGGAPVAELLRAQLEVDGPVLPWFEMNALETLEFPHRAGGAAGALVHFIGRNGAGIRDLGCYIQLRTGSGVLLSTLRF